MRTKVVLCLAVLAALVFFTVRNPLRPPRPEPLSSPGQTTPKSGEPAAAPPNTPGQPAPTADKAALPLSEEARWEQPVAEPRFAAFKEWTERYRQASGAEAKAALEEEGVALARARLSAMADLIQSNPERALQLAVPGTMRGELPPSVRGWLEEQVNTRGDYQVLGVMPLAGSEAKLPPVVRAAMINGEQHEVFTYGRALGFVTKQDVPLNGIAVPVSAATVSPSHRLIQRTRLMALEGSGGRVTTVNRRSPAYLQEPVCSVSGQPVEVAAESGDAIKTFCGKVHADDWLNAGIAAAGMETPSGATLPTAESSYTEGRKRMLLMRPIWSDYTGGMTTNDALTHFQSFSNYMFEMSYGKLMLAPLGKGSAITPAMTLPGLVADYDDTGLGLLYNTCRSVASSTYGYDLADFDFTYVCTGGAPAADYAGLAFVGGVGFHLANSSWGSGVSSHEFGHNLGLNHAHFWDTAERSIIGNGQNVEYGDNNDPMGGGSSPNSFNSRYKNYLGWIRDTDIADLNLSGSGLYRLYCFDLDTSVGLRGLKFARDASQNYWLNFRQRKTNKKALMNGVQLLWTGNGNQGSYLLDVRLKGDADDNAIAIGRTFSDPALGFHITPVGKGHTFPESMDVRVNIGTFPGNLPPKVVVSASPLNANPAQVITFTAAATDPNGDTLAYYWDFGDGDYSVDNKAVTTHPFSSAGEYAVQCTASDMKGGTARHTVVVRVGNPTVFRIAGRVLDDQNRPMAGIRVSTSTGRSAFSDSDGSYVIPGLAAGSYSIDATEPLSAGYTFLHPTFSNPLTVGPSIANADLVGLPGSLDIYTPLVARSATGWRFLDNGSDQGTAWRAPGFNDSTWGSGTAPLGYPSGDPINTVISYGPDANNKYITYYFRHSFNVTDPNAFTNLLLEVLRDDSAVVYINGTEVFRDNLPAGTITYTTPALDNSGASSYLSATLPRSLLVPGINYLAGEAHQVLPTSSDVVFDAALSGLSVSNATGFKFIYLANPANNSGFTNPPSIPMVATAFSGAGAITLVEFFAGGVKLGEDADAPYAFPWINPPVGEHLLTAVATITGSGQLTSPPVAVTVSAPPSLAVQLAGPANGASFNLPASVSVSAAVTGAAAGVTTVEFFADGASLGTDVSAPYTATLTEVLPGSRQLIAVATDALGNSATSAPVSISFTQPASGSQIISFGDVWKYLDDGSDQGTAWRNLIFDDRLWSAGPGRLGYGGDGEITVVSFGPNVNQRYVTTYFRKSFLVANPAAYRGLLLRLQRDDGAAVYLNGVEVLRDNLQPGLISWNTLATAALEGAPEAVTLEATLSTANLVAGTNVIAVEIHQAAINNSDLGFDLALIGLDAATPSQNIHLTEPAQGARFNGPTNIALACYAAAADGAPPLSVTYSADGAVIGTGSAAPPFGSTWNGAPVGSHELVAVADWGSGLFTTSAVVGITVGTPLPRIQPLTISLLGPGAAWRYWDNVAAVGTGWQMREFNDSAWPQGTARFGWGLDGENTTLTEGRITHYFRRWFFMPTPASYTELVFQLARDDGAIVYLNGMEIFRSNMPDGTATAATLASTGINTPDETTYFERVLLTSGSGIAAGTNLLAVELHQSSATSSDGGFDLQLAAYGTTEGRVYLATPLESSTYSGSPNISMEAFAKGAGTAAVVNVEFFANDQKLGERSSSPYTLTWSNAPLGAFLLTARSTDGAGYTAESGPVQIAVGRERVSTTFIAANSSGWRYLDNGSNQGTNWTLRTYNDATWKTGTTRLGYGGDGETLPAVSYGPNANNKYITTYFRRTFVVQPGAVYTNLLFRTVCDDGAVVYLNGQEVYRINMPLGPVSYTTLAGGQTDEQAFIAATLAVADLVGTNVVAAEVHQASTNSGDLGFNLELTASGYEDITSLPVLDITLAEGLVELRWPTTTAPNWRLFSAANVSAPASGWRPAVGSLVQVGGQNVFTAVPGSTNLFYRLRKL